jgi:hypothetical protein
MGEVKNAPQFPRLVKALKERKSAAELSTEPMM